MSSRSSSSTDGTLHRTASANTASYCQLAWKPRCRLRCASHLKSKELERDVLTGKDIVCLSTQDWNGLWTRKQRFMKMFAEAGNRILYIETPVHLLGLDFLPNDPRRFFRFLEGPRLMQERLYVATLPILLPMFQMSSLINEANQTLIGMTLRHWLKKLRFERPLLWIYTPFSARLIDLIHNSGAVYECVDEFRAARGLVRSSVIGRM